MIFIIADDAGIWELKGERGLEDESSGGDYFITVIEIVLLKYFFIPLEMNQ